MTKRERYLMFQTIELLRKTASKLQDFVNASDWKNVDDWLFSELDWTAEDIDELYYGRDALVFTGSTIPGFAPAGLTYEELLPFVGVPCVCKKLDLPWGKPVVVQADIPGNPILLRSGDCPELQDRIGAEIRVIATEQGVCLVTEGSALLYKAEKDIDTVLKGEESDD